MYLKNEFESKYCIARHKAPSDHTPPWKDMAFDPPIGSDELSDRLKAAFPEGQTLRQRKYLAAIAFLQGELQQIKAEDANRLGPSTPSSIQNAKSISSVKRHRSHELLIDSHRESPASCDSPSVASSAQSASSPSLVDRGTCGTDQDSKTDGWRPSTPNPIGTTIVFNSVNGRTVQPKTKRKMTQQERKAYKETRIRGACVKCKKTKGKCTHNDDLEAGHLDTNHVVPIPGRRNTIEDSSKRGELVNDRQHVERHQLQPSDKSTPPFEDQQLGQFGQGEAFVMPSVDDGLWTAGATPAENPHKYVHPRPSSMPYQDLPPDDIDHGWPSFRAAEEDYSPAFGTHSHQTFPTSSPIEVSDDQFCFQRPVFATQHWASHLGNPGPT